MRKLTTCRFFCVELKTNGQVSRENFGNLLRVWTEFTRHVQSWLDSVADAPSISQFTVDITNSGGGHDLVLLDGPGMLGCIEVSDAHAGEVGLTVPPTLL